MQRPSSGHTPAVHLAHGLLMGAADSIPGVSGGTMALIVGIYEDLLASIGSGFRAVVSALRFDLAGARSHLAAVSWRLIIPLALGIVTAIVIAASFLPDLLEDYPSQMRGLFLGMVAASISIPWRRIAARSVRIWTITVIAAVVAFVLTGFPEASPAEPSMLRVFATAAVAICAMILPGVSGAFLLEVLGMYEPTLTAVDERDLVYIGVFVVGAAAGLGTFSLLLNALLRRRHDETMAGLVGLMAGSLRALWPWQDAARSIELPPSTGAGLTVLMLTVIGFGFVLGIERFGAHRAETAAPESDRSETTEA